MLDVLENNILRFWLDKMQDRENGGFYGRMDGHGQLYPEAEKGAILNARILWAFSAAYRVLSHLSPLKLCNKEQLSAWPNLQSLEASPTITSHLSEYLEAATRAKEYVINHFIDKEYGGVYWSVDCKGQPLDTKKQFYAIGFAIYGLSEYARATGDGEALDYALQLYDCIEQHALDPEHNGYIEACTRDWQPIADMRLSELDANYPKSQNTHLHIIEPYTNLYRALKELKASPSPSKGGGVWLPGAIASPTEICNPTSPPLEGLGEALRNLIGIFTEKILNPETHHLDLFFEMDWTRGGGQTESYGHDIECSWLMHEAALVLGDKKVLEKVEPIVQMVAKASEKGLRPDGSMIHESCDDDLHWWVQAENVVGWLNLYQHFGDEEALQRASRCWEYIKHNLIDYEHGEWFWSRRNDGTLNLDDDHAGFWKCPYHNSRMCLETIERFA